MVHCSCISDSLIYKLFSFNFYREDFNSNEAKISKKLVGIKSEELRKNKPVSLESEMDAENDDNIR